MKTTSTFFLTLLLTAPVFGQGVLPGGGAPQPKPAPAAAPAPAPAPPAAQQSPTAGTAGNYSSSTTEGMADRLFNVNSDSVDLENGSLQWKGRTFNLGNARFLRARLERYLAAPVPKGDTARYEEILAKIDQLLSPKNITAENARSNFQEAWNLLFEAGQFDFDAENCLTIASLVEKTMAAQIEFRNLMITRKQKEALRKYQREGVVSAASIREQENDYVSDRANLGTKERPKTYRERQEGRTDLQERRRDVAQTEAEIVRTEADMTAMGIKMKLEYQSQIVAFLFQRRFQHAIIASSFYRQIFKGSSQELKVGEKQVREMFPVSDFMPSIDSVDMLAREAMKDVEVGIGTVSHLYDTGDRYAAFERMQETFFLGEYDPRVMFYDQNKKQTLMEIWRNLRDLQRMGDERDLAGVEDAVNKVKALAQDFPAVQVMSRVNNAMQTSNLAVLSAKQAALMGDMAKAEVQIERATTIWPTNPAIKDFAVQVVNRADLLSQKIPEFDRLYQGGKYRDVYNRKEEFAVALLQDPVRADQLKTVLNNVGQVDGYMLNAKALSSQGNSYMAWDILQEAMRIGANDPELAKARSEMAPLVADYARLLATADKYEKSANYAASLSEYLAAQDLNPSSEFCRQSIHRLSNRLMDEMMLVPSAMAVSN